MSVPRASTMLKPKIQMQTLTKTYMVAIKDFDHMTTMDENVNSMKSVVIFLF